MQCLRIKLTPNNQMNNIPTDKAMYYLLQRNGNLSEE